MSGSPIRPVGGTGKGGEGRGEMPTAGASTAAAAAATCVIDILLKNVSACAEVLRVQMDQLGGGGESCIEGEGGPSEESGSDEDTG